VASNVMIGLGPFVRQHRLGVCGTADSGLLLARDPDTVRAPDVAFVRRERVEAVGRVSGYWPGAPDLAVEVTSPGDTHSQVVEKALSWLDAVCRMVMTVEPEQRAVTVYRSRQDIRILTSGDAIEGADVVPGWKLPVAELFA
jgi:Uma2 family endonuclease